jgi:hypothetical protein
VAAPINNPRTPDELGFFPPRVSMSQQASVGEPRGPKGSLLRLPFDGIRPLNQGTFRVPGGCRKHPQEHCAASRMRLAKEVADRTTGSTAAKATSKELSTKGTKTR